MWTIISGESKREGPLPLSSAREVLEADRMNTKKLS